MRLATPEEVLAVAGIQAGAGSVVVAGAALDATFPAVESLLDTSLVRSHRIDWFDIGKWENSNAQLSLSQSFVDEDEPFVVKVNGVEVPADSYTLRADSGVVRMSVCLPQGKEVVSVEYFAGFELDTLTEGNLVGLPDGLVQGGISYAAAYMLLNPANSPKDKARYLAQTALRGFELKAGQCFAPYMRYRTLVIWPAFSQVLA